MTSLGALVSGVDSESSLERMKENGRNFMTVYSEFVYYRDLAISMPAFAEKWKTLNRVALSVFSALRGTNAHLDSINSITKAMFGNTVLSMFPTASNIYLMSGNGALSYAIMEMKRFNAVMAKIVKDKQNAKPNDK